ncbi:MAG: hypothetical protein PVJ86_09725 [Phycisphaerales bacterium]|jgi:hypothetical protein
MLLGMRLKKIVGFLLVLGIAGPIGIVPREAEAQEGRTAAALRHGTADYNVRIKDMATMEDNLVAIGNSTYSEPFVFHSYDWHCVYDISTDPWTILSEIEYPPWPHNVSAVELIRHSGQTSVVVLEKRIGRLLHYTLDGQLLGETLLPGAINGLTTAYNDFAVAHIGSDIDPQPLIFVVGTAINADDVPCVVCGAPDGSGYLVVAWNSTYEQYFEGYAMTKISAASDGTSAYCVLLGEARDIYGNVVSQMVAALEGATREDPGTIRNLAASDGLSTEFVDVAAVSDSMKDVWFGHALANEETPERGTRTAHYYWKVDEFSVTCTHYPIAEPGEPGGNVRGEGLYIDKGKVKWFNPRRGGFMAVAGTTDGPIGGGPPPIGGSDVWLATLRWGDGGFDVDNINAVWLWGTPGDDDVTAMSGRGQYDFFALGGGGQYAIELSVSIPSGQSFMGMEPVGGGGMDSVVIAFTDVGAMIEALIAKVESLNLHQGIENSLDVKLENAKKSLESVKAGNRQDAVNKLDAFVNECAAQSGKTLTADQADDLIADALDIIHILLL